MFHIGMKAAARRHFSSLRRAFAHLQGCVCMAESSSCAYCCLGIALTQSLALMRWILLRLQNNKCGTPVVLTTLESPSDIIDTVAKTKPLASKVKMEDSQPHGVKRERSDDEGEEETRRTDGNSATSSDIKEYIETIIVHSGDEEALTEAMEKLRFAVIWRNEMFHELGGPFVVVVVMKNHIDCELLQQHGIAILEHVTGCLSRAERRVLVGEIGGIQAILSAMERYPLSDDIQYGSLRALSNLTWHAQNAEIFALETDGITRMIHAMNKFSGSSTIVDKCCDLLSNLSKTEKVRKALRDNNVVTTLAATADCHKEDKRIQKPVGEVMKKLFE